MGPTLSAVGLNSAAHRLWSSLSILHSCFKWNPRILNGFKVCVWRMRTFAIHHFSHKRGKFFYFRWSQCLLLRRNKNSQMQSSFSSQMHVYNLVILLRAFLCWSMSHFDLSKDPYCLVMTNILIALNCTYNLPFQHSSCFLFLL